LELWNGCGGDQEQKKLREFDVLVPALTINDTVWELSLKLGRNARTRGITVPAIDLLIAACAFYHDAEIESVDAHFQRLSKWR
jgi:predicted nucleic acid-binding protein